MFRKVLIANRGVIACRVIRTLRKLGVSPIAVYSEADRHGLHVAHSDTAVLLGPPAAAESYLNQTAILRAARKTAAEAIHPGYGFLSENAEFADACENAGIIFLGPSGDHMRALGLKHKAREIAVREGIPLLPGSGLLRDLAHAMEEAENIGYPVILKSTAGGGGIGMRICRTPESMGDSFDAASRLGMANFGHAGVYLERYIEKAPAAGISAKARQQLWGMAERLARALHYRSAGTVEFLYDSDREEFFFLEVNTRLQVEHAVTEEVTGIDIVEWMVRLGAGELGALEELRPKPRGASIQVRIYAEDPADDFRPSTGTLTEVRLPA